MLLIHRALGYPPAKQLLLRRGEDLVGRGRGHQIVRARGENALMSSLWSGLPGTNASLASASSRMSRRILPLRLFGSGPWQKKQLSESTGRISRL